MESNNWVLHPSSENLPKTDGDKVGRWCIIRSLTTTPCKLEVEPSQGRGLHSRFMGQQLGYQNADWFTLAGKFYRPVVPIDVGTHGPELSKLSVDSRLMLYRVDKNIVAEEKQQQLAVSLATTLQGANPG